MHDMILEQPGALHSTLELCRKEASDITSYWEGSTQFILTGCGTSFHAALAGSYMLYALFQRTNSEAVQSFELARYFRRLNPRTVVTAFSHTGNTKTTIDAVKMAREAGAATLALTGTSGSNISKEAQRTLVVGNGKEKSRAHTKSYTSSLLASMYLSSDFVARLASNSLAESYLEQLNDVPQYVHEAIAKEKEVAHLATNYHKDIKRYFFIGAGPNVATALEAALKMKESNYSSAEGMELEQFLHGPWVSLDPQNSLVFLIAPKGPSHDRYLDLLGACKEIGVRTVALTDDKHIVDLCTHSIFMPEITEELSPLTYVVPLQLFSYYVSVQKGINPDFIHYQDPRFWSARSIVFPPGTH